MTEASMTHANVSLLTTRKEGPSLLDAFRGQVYRLGSRACQL